MTKIQQIIAIGMAGMLAGCVGDGVNYPPQYQAYSYGQSQYSQESYTMTGDYGYSDLQPRGQVTVPNSYYVGAAHSPTSAKDRDRNWVSSQNPNGYTIEIADDEKAAQVAKKLYQIPKNETTAEVKYQRDGKAYYKGLYGSYSSQEEAQKALDSLPAEVKQGAGVKNWSHVQSNVNN